MQALCINLRQAPRLTVEFDAATESGSKVIAVAAADYTRNVRDILNDRFGANVSEFTVSPLTDAELQGIVETFTELRNLYNNSRSRELLRRLGDALSAISGLDAKALTGLQQDGLLQAPTDNIVPDFAHDEVRRYAVAQLLNHKPPGVGRRPSMMSPAWRSLGRPTGIGLPGLRSGTGPGYSPPRYPRSEPVVPASHGQPRPDAVCCSAPFSAVHGLIAATSPSPMGNAL